MAHLIEKRAAHYSQCHFVLTDALEEKSCISVTFHGFKFQMVIHISHLSNQVHIVFQMAGTGINVYGKGCGQSFYGGLLNFWHFSNTEWSADNTEKRNDLTTDMN